MHVLAKTNQRVIPHSVTEKPAYFLRCKHLNNDRLEMMEGTKMIALTIQKENQRN